MSDWVDVPIEEEWEDVPTGRQWKDVPKSAAKNILPGLFIETPKEIYKAVKQPVKTGQGLVDIAGGAVKELSPIQPDGLMQYSLLGKLLNMAQEAVIPGDREKAKAAGEALKQQYLTEEGWKETLAERPQEPFIDLISMLYGGAGLASKSTKLPKLAKAGKTVQKVMKAPLRAPAKAMKGTAEYLYQSAIPFSKGVGFAGRRKATKAGLRHELRLTEKGMDKLDSLVDDFAKQRNTILDDLGKSGTRIETETLFKKLDEFKGKPTKLPQTRDNYINKLINEQYWESERLGRTWRTPREIQDLKTDIYDDINFGSLKADSMTTAVDKKYARAAKEAADVLDERIPALNEEIGPLLALKDPAYDVAFAGKKMSEHPIAAGTVGRISAGMAGGGVGTQQVGALLGWLTSPSWRASRAVDINKAGSLLDLILSSPGYAAPAYYGGRVTNNE